jgi:hypothetical protein
MDPISIQNWTKSFWLPVHIFIVALSSVVVLVLAFVIKDSLAPFLIVDDDAPGSMVPKEAMGQMHR